MQNISGQILISRNFGYSAGSQSIDLAGFGKGIYFLKLSGEGKTITKKLIVN